MMMTLPYVPAAFAVLLEAAVRGTVLLAAALVATRLMRRRSAAARHLVWLVALSAVLALPLLTPVLPAWKVVPMPAPLRPAAAFVAASAAPAPAVVPSSTHLPQPSSGVAAKPGFGEKSASSLATTTAAAAPAAAFDWKTALLALWGAGMALLALRLVFGLGRVWWMESRAVEITDDEWVNTADRLARKLRVGRMVTLLREPHAQVPMTWGIVRPVVLLPAEAEEWDAERRTVVLAHELAHVRRWDCLTQWVANAALALFWFHPLVWMAARRMREEREHACDDAVLSLGTRPVVYADHLLDIVRSLGQSEGPAAALAMARRSQFEGRLLAILDGATPRGGVSRGLGMAALGVAALAVLPLAALGAAEPHAVRAPSSASLTLQKQEMRVDAGATKLAAEAPKSPLAKLASRIDSALDRVTGSDAKPKAGDPVASPVVNTLTLAPAATVPAPPARASAASGPMGASPTDAELAKVLQGKGAAALDAVVSSRAAQQDGDGKYAEIIRAANSISSPGDRANVLLAVLRRGDLATADLVGVLRSAAGISSDGDRARVLKAAFARATLVDAPVRRAFFSAVESITSPGDRRDVLMTALREPSLCGEGLAGVIAAVPSIASPGDQRDILMAAVKRGDATPTHLSSAIQVMRHVPSPGDQRDMLMAVLAKPSLTQQVLVDVFTAASEIPSPGDQKDILVRAAGSHGARFTPGTRAAYLAAAQKIASDGDRATAVSALLGAGETRTTESRTAGPASTTTGSSHIHVSNGSGVWNAQIGLDLGSRHVNILARDVERGSSKSDIRGIRRGGRLMVEEILPGRTRRIDIVPTSDGTLRRSYTVNGQARPVSEAQGWFASILNEFASSN